MPESGDDKPWPAHTKALDEVVVTLIGVGGVAMLIGNIVILCNRSYTPIKSKSVPLTLLSSLGGLIWIVAALVVNHHFKRTKDSGLDICSLWTFWLQACFGFALWLNCLTLRLIALYRVFICNRGNRDIRIYYLFLILLLLPAVAICIAGSIKMKGHISFQVPPTPSPGKDPGKVDGDCRFPHKAFLADGLIALLVIYFLIFVGFAFKLQNAMAQFNEFRLIRRGGVLSLFLFLLSLVTLNTRAYDQPVGRCLLSAAVASTIFYYFWARNGTVIYNVMFNRDEYLEKFHKDLKRSPSQHEREKSSAVLSQLREVRAEVESHQVKIKELEDEVKELEQDYAARQRRTSPYSSPKSS